METQLQTEIKKRFTTMAIIQRGFRTNMNTKTTNTADFNCGTILPNHSTPKS